MKEKLKSEIKYYAKLNNEKWGGISGALLGTGMGIYMLVQHQEIIPVADGIIKIALEITAIPFSAGLGSLLLSSLGKAIDTITHEKTALTPVLWCRRIYKERQPEFLFFRNGERYRDTYGNSRNAQELTLRHIDSSSEMVSENPTPRTRSSSDVVINVNGQQETTPLMQRAEVKVSIDRAIQRDAEKQQEMGRPPKPGEKFISRSAHN